MLLRIRYFLPIAVVITLLCGLVYVAVQQNLRQSANDPQIQLSEDISNAIDRGETYTQFIYPAEVDLSKSLAPFVIVYDYAGNILFSNAQLDGVVPQIPNGVLDYTKAHRENRVTWQPRERVRIAAVITVNEKGYVLAGRSLREIENRVDVLGKHIILAWLITMILSFVAVLLFVPNKK